jgi:hypothetical protein
MESITYNLYKNVKEKGLFFIYNYKLEKELSDAWDTVK